MEQRSRQFSYQTLESRRRRRKWRWGGTDDAPPKFLYRWRISIKINCGILTRVTSLQHPPWSDKCCTTTTQAKLSQQIGIAARPLRTNLQNDVVVLDELFNNDASFTDSLTKVSQRRLVCDHRHTFDRGWARFHDQGKGGQNNFVGRRPAKCRMITMGLKKNWYSIKWAFKRILIKY